MKVSTVLRVIVLAYFLSFLHNISAANKNLLESSDTLWGIRKIAGATGWIKKQPDGSITLQKQNNKGFIFLVNEKNYPVVPSKTYEVSIFLKTDLPTVKSRVMVSMPGSKRTPYPVSSWYTPTAQLEQASLIFKARADEKNLRIHLVIEGKGSVYVSKVTVQELKPIDGRTLIWQGNILKHAWQPFNLYKKEPAKNYLSATVMPNGGFFTEFLDWQAKSVKAVEIKFRAFDEGGYVQLAWEAQAGGKLLKSHLTRSIPPDGEWHTLVFNVSRDQNWQGNIKALKVTWHSLYAPCKVELKQVAALPEINLIPGASRVALGKSVKIAMIKPRGEYSLHWENGKNPEVKVSIYDYNKKFIKTITLAIGQHKIKFKVPELAAYGVIKAATKSSGYPVLQMEKLKPLNCPEYWWKASWIWSRNGVGPSDYVWFSKSFNLPVKPKYGTVLFTGDDAIIFYLNGKLFHGNSEWASATKTEVTNTLKQGRNEIVVRVLNIEAWGGLLFELFAEMDQGKTIRVCSDKTWRCHEGGKTQPSKIASKPHIFGLPPVAPWGSAVSYKYIGPLAEAKIKKMTKQKVISTQIPPAKVKIVGAGKRAWFMINNRHFAPIYFDMPYSYASDPENKLFFLKNAVKGDMRIIRFSYAMRKMWLAPNKFDFSQFDKAMNLLVATAPQRYVLPVISSYMPEWWLKQNPSETTKYYGNLKRNSHNDFQSLGSKKWLTDVSVAYRKLIAHILKQSYGSRIIGMSPVDGTTWEWIWNHGRGHNKRTYSGFSAAAINGYRKFLQKKYGPLPRFKTIMPPTPKQLDASSVVNMLNPAKDHDLIDWFDYRNATVADAIIHLCRTIKEASGNNWISGTYYGYLIMFSRMYFHLQDGGHLGINKIAKSPYIDFVFGPTMYPWRRLGMSGSPMQPSEAFTSHGKLVICEMDYRVFTEPTDYERRNGKVDTVEQSAAVMNRGLAMILTRGLGGHYMELHERWFHEPVLLKIIKDQLELYRSLPSKPHGYIPVEVCVVSDEVSPLYVKNNMGDGIHVALIAELLKRIREAGFAYRHVLLPDLLTPGLLPKHKLYIMTNTMVLSKKQRQQIKQRLKKENASVLFLYAPGAFYPDRGPNATNINDMIGIKTSMLESKQSMTMQVSSEFGGMTVLCKTRTGPWFPLLSGYDVILGRAPDGQILAGGRKEGKRMIWFSAVPNLPPALLRKLASDAGVWIYSTTGDPLHVGNDFLFLHTKSSGKKSFKLPAGLRAKAVIGPYSGLLKSAETWNAESGLTYGFMLEKSKN